MRRKKIDHTEFGPWTWDQYATTKGKANLYKMSHTKKTRMQAYSSKKDNGINALEDNQELLKA